MDDAAPRTPEPGDAPASSVSWLEAPDGARIAVRSWLSQGRPRAVVVLAHGMAEHAARYEGLGTALAGAGIALLAEDHRGHGLTATEAADGAAPLLGHVADADGWELVLGDLSALLDSARDRFPGVPLILFGHSWGSFLVRILAARRGGELAGLVVMGTGGDPGAVGVVGAAAARAVCAARGASRPSPLLDTLVIGGYNRAFSPARTPCDWLSRDEAEVDAYVADPWCGFVCSASFYRDLAEGAGRASRPEAFRVPEELPVLVISGAEDPVGARGRGPREVAAAYRRAGVRDVSLRLYPGARHELLHETCRGEAVDALLSWFNAHC